MHERSRNDSKRDRTVTVAEEAPPRWVRQSIGFNEDELSTACPFNSHLLFLLLHCLGCPMSYMRTPFLALDHYPTLSLDMLT